MLPFFLAFALGLAVSTTAQDYDQLRWGMSIQEVQTSLKQSLAESDALSFDFNGVTDAFYFYYGNLITAVAPTINVAVGPAYQTSADSSSSYYFHSGRLDAISVSYDNGNQLGKLTHQLGPVTPKTVVESSIFGAGDYQAQVACWKTTDNIVIWEQSESQTSQTVIFLDRSWFEQFAKAQGLQ